MTARKLASLEDLVQAWPGHITPIAMELRDAHQCEEAVRTAADRMGGIDVLVNNAGSGLFGTVEEVSDAELRDQIETLLVGPWRLARLVLPSMRAQGGGHIVNISSLAGRMAFPGLASYVAGKHALEGMCQALAAEVAPFGVRVTAVEPGVFATRYGSALAEAAHRLPDYAEATGEMLGGFRAMEDNEEYGRPEDFADGVLAIVASDAPTPCASRSGRTPTPTWRPSSRRPARSSRRPAPSPDRRPDPTDPYPPPPGPAPSSGGRRAAFVCRAGPAVRSQSGRDHLSPP